MAAGACSDGVSLEPCCLHAGRLVAFRASGLIDRQLWAGVPLGALFSTGRAGLPYARPQIAGRPFRQRRCDCGHRRWFRFCAPTLSDPPSERGAQIRVVQPNIAQNAKWDEGSRKANILQLLALSARAGDYDILLWPETAWPGFLAEDTGARVMLGWLLQDTTVLLAGSPEREVTATGTVYRNSVLAVAHDGSILTRYAKYHLVPFGEYVPWRSVLPFQRLVESLGDFSPG